jgi:putative aminopeptidase FrvX
MLLSLLPVKAKAIELLRELTTAHAVSGHEGEVRQIFARETAECGAVSTDRMGSVFCEIPHDGPRVLLAGHMDEIGFLVQAITPDGFIQFHAVGGWWEHCILAQRVVILTRSGAKITGVVSSKPPHFLPESQRRQVLGIDQMYIDVGASSRLEVEQEMGIRLGDPIAPDSTFTPMAKADYFMAKAFDNRVGMAAAIQLAQALAVQKAPNHTILAGTVQEEVGLRGAKPAGFYSRPDIAIILEGPPADDTPGFPLSTSQGRLGGGVQIRLYDPSAIMHPKLADLVIKTAQEEKIPHQITVRRGGGTDAGAFHLANEGVPCVVLGVPARYIHTHNAIIDLNDYLHMVALALAVVRRLDQATVDGLLTYL